MGATSRFVAAQVSGLLALFTFASVARADPTPDPERFVRLGCAGDGAPHDRLELSALLAVEGVAYSGAAASLRSGDAADRAGFWPRTARVAICGRSPTRAGWLTYQLAFEPWDLVERAHPDANVWGRLITAELGLAPWTWLGIYVGVRKVAFSYGHDEPEQALTLPIRPYITSSVAPDRRLGVTIDDNFGAAHIVLGLYEGARDLLPSAAGGFILTARLVAEPIGPVGNRLSTVDDAPLWRRRVRFTGNASILVEYAQGNTRYALGADVELKYGPLGVGVEYLTAAGTLVESPTKLPVPRLDRQGLWAGAALMMWRPYLELAARYDWMSTPHDPQGNFHAITAGLNGYLLRNLLRAQIVYSHKFHGFADDVLLLTATLAR